MAQRRVLLNAKVPMNLACLRSIVSWLKRDHSISLYLTSRWRGTHLRPGKVLEGLPRGYLMFVGINVIPAFVASRMHFDLYLSPDMAMPGSHRAQTKVHLFHGVSFKGASISPKALAYDRLFLFGEYQRRRFVEKGIVPEGDPRLEMIGFPKLDQLVDGSLDQAIVRSELELEKDRPTVLYAPTWKGTSLESDGDAIVDALSAMDVNVLVKLHDHSLDSGLAGRRWAARLEAWRQRPNVKVFDNPDVCPALAVADVLVSDFSSVANEFTLLDRPIVFFDTPALEKSYSAKQIDHAMLERRPGRRVTRAAELSEAVSHALANRDEFSAERRALARDLFHRPGTATIRAIKRIYETLEVEPFLPTQWAIDAGMRQAEADAAKCECEEDLTVVPFEARGRYPGQAPMV